MNLLDFLFGGRMGGPEMMAERQRLAAQAQQRQQLTPPLDEDEATLAARRAANWKAWEEMERKLDMPAKGKK